MAAEMFLRFWHVKTIRVTTKQFLETSQRTDRPADIESKRDHDRSPWAASSLLIPLTLVLPWTPAAPGD